jgi:chemotaxis methyl-accepting protein methylase
MSGRIVVERPNDEGNVAAARQELGLQPLASPMTWEGDIMFSGSGDNRGCYQQIRDKGSSFSMTNRWGEQFKPGWTKDARVVDFFVSEFEKEAKRAKIGDCVVTPSMLREVMEEFTQIGVFPDLFARREYFFTGDKSGERQVLAFKPVDWDSSAEKIDLALRLALASALIPEPDGRTVLLENMLMQGGQDDIDRRPLVERARDIGRREGKSVRELYNSILMRLFPEARADTEFLKKLYVWPLGVGWFNHRQQNAQVARELQDPNKKKVWWVGVYNGEELAGLALDLRHKWSIKRPLNLVGTDIVPPNKDRMMFARRTDIEGAIGREGLERWFDAVGLTCEAPKRELLDQLTLKQGDLAKSFEAGCDVVVCNGVLHAMPEGLWHAALENVFQGVSAGGVVFSENDSYDIETGRKKRLTEFVEGYVDLRQDLEFEQKDTANQTYAIRKKR